MGRFMIRFSDSFDNSTEFGNPSSMRKTLRIRIKKKQKLRKTETNSVIINPEPQTSTTVVYWQKIQPDRWSPSTRQQATLTAFNNNLYLIGGISRTISQDVHIYSLASKDWSKLQTITSLEPRFGHSAILYSSSILIFGGGTYYNSTHQLRECLNGLRKLNLQTNQWTYIKTSGTFIQSRKGHVSCIIGKHLFVSGGLNEKHHILADSAVLDLKKLAWSFLEIFNPGPLALAYHSACSVQAENSNLSIYKTKEKNLKTFGIFVFGGIDSQKRPKNDLLHIVPGTRPVECFVVETKGKPPCPRFLHSMVYCQRLKYLVVFGGRVDIKDEKEYTCFNDVFLFWIEQSMWVNVKVTGTVPTERAGHCADVCGNDIYIFGGVSNSFYCSSEIFMLQIAPEFKIDQSKRRRASYFQQNSTRNPLHSP